MKINEIIDDLLSIINLSLVEVNISYNDYSLERISQHMLERIKKNLVTLNLLIINDINIHDHAVGLICRNLLTDFILISSLYIRDDRNEQLVKYLYGEQKIMHNHLNLLIEQNFNGDEAKKYLKKHIKEQKEGFYNSTGIKFDEYPYIRPEGTTAIVKDLIKKII